MKREREKKKEVERNEERERKKKRERKKERKSLINITMQNLLNEKNWSIDKK